MACTTRRDRHNAPGQARFGSKSPGNSRSGYFWDLLSVRPVVSSAASLIGLGPERRRDYFVNFVLGLWVLLLVGWLGFMQPVAALIRDTRVNVVGGGRGSPMI